MRGSIKRHGKSWAIVLDVGRDPATGKRQQRWIGGLRTRREAESRLAEALDQARKGTLVRPTRVTVRDFLTQWLDTTVATRLRPRSLENYRQKVTAYVLPSLGALPLQGLQPSHIQSLYARLLEKGRASGGPLAPSTVLYVHRIISEALSHAADWGLVSRNAAKTVKPPKRTTVEPRALTPEEARRLVELAKGSPYFLMVYLALMSGMRRSELLGLRWGDVDLRSGTLSVKQGVHMLKGGKVVFHAPKTARGRRSIVLPPSAVLALRGYREQQEGDAALLGGSLRDQDLVFHRWDGSPLRPSSFTRAVKALARKAGLPWLRLHDLRHACATFLLSQGTHPKVVQERLGHSTISVTMDTYSHVLGTLQQEAARALDAAMGVGREFVSKP